MRHPHPTAAWQNLASPDEAAARVQAERDRFDRVVLAVGVFNFISAEIVDRLRTVRRPGDLLIVAVAPGALANDPNGLPLLSQRTRAEVVATLPEVDVVFQMDPAFPEEAYVSRIAADLIFGDADSPFGWPLDVFPANADTQSHSEVAVASPWRSDSAGYLAELAGRFPAEDVVRRIDELADLRVLVLGDAIVDEYHFCQPYGMPMKVPIIAAQFEQAEQHAGGAFAVANHVASVCRAVTLVTCLGQQDAKDAFVRRRLVPNVDLQAFYRPDAPTTVKRRYLRRFLMHRLFEISYFNDAPVDPAVEGRVCDYLEAVLPDIDLVLVADFGHGFVTPRIVDVLVRRAKFLAVNTQANSINKGFHVITQYPRADYACLDEDEVRFACRARYEDLEGLVRRLADELGASWLTVTRGHHGSLTYERESARFARAPVLSRGVIDTIGAGDAFLSFAAPCAARGFPAELTTFIGNCAGALAVGIVGNRQPIAREVLVRTIRDLLR